MRAGCGVLQAALAAGLLLAAGCLPALGQQVHENTGRLCFETTPDGATMVEHQIDGCFSAGCTDVPERSVVATATQEPPAIRVHVRVVTAPSDAVACNADCNFVPRTGFDLGVVPSATYEVHLGDRLVGKWAPVPGAEPACLPTS